MKWDDVVKWMAGIAGALAGLLGEWNVLLTILAIMMVLDYVTGLIVAWRGKSPKTEGGGVSSSVGFDGLIKKAFIMVVVLIATLLDTAIGNATRVFQLAATMYYIANEGISVLENTAIMGVKYPRFIMKALEAMREKNDNPDGENDDKTPETDDKIPENVDKMPENVDKMPESAENAREDVIDLDRYIYHRKDKPPGEKGE